MPTAVILAGRIGESDCEAIGDGLLAQPVNALTSLAYVAVAVWVVVWSRRLDPSERRYAAAYAAVLAAIGLGSVAFHGPMPSWAKFVHDLPIALLFVVVLAQALAAAGPGRRGVVALGIAGTVVALTAGFWFLPGVTIGLSGVVAVAALGAETRRWVARRTPPPPETLRAFAGAVGLFLVAAGLNALGRTGGPLCDPETLLQLHGLWHVLGAVAFGLLAQGLFGASAEDPADSMVGPSRS